MVQVPFDLTETLNIDRFLYASDDFVNFYSEAIQNDVPVSVGSTVPSLAPVYLYGWGSTNTFELGSQGNPINAATTPDRLQLAINAWYPDTLCELFGSKTLEQHYV